MKLLFCFFRQNVLDLLKWLTLPLATELDRARMNSEFTKFFERQNTAGCFPKDWCQPFSGQFQITLFCFLGVPGLIPSSSFESQDKEDLPIDVNPTGRHDRACATAPFQKPNPKCIKLRGF